MVEFFGLPYYYYMLGITAIFAVYHFYNDNKKSISQGMEVARAVKNRNKKFLFKSNSKITDEQYKNLLYGAMLAQYSEDNLNELKCLGNKSELKDGLNEWWGINNTQSFLSTIEWLFEAGHRFYYPQLIKIIKNTTESERKRIVDELSRNSDRDLWGYCSNIPKSLVQMQKAGLIKNGEENLSVLSWDMGRVINLSRAAFTLGYITEKQAWGIIERAADEMKNNYNNWEETARAYMLGRGMWTSEEGQLQYTIADYKLLTQDNESPYNFVSFK